MAVWEHIRLNALSLPFILGVLLPAAGLLRRRVTRAEWVVSAFFFPGSNTLCIPWRNQILPLRVVFVLCDQNTQAQFSMYALINSCFYIYLLGAGHSAAPIHPRWFLNDSSVELHHPVINSLVHTLGVQGMFTMHQRPHLRFPCSVSLPIRLFSCNASTVYLWQQLPN